MAGGRAALLVGPPREVLAAAAPARVTEPPVDSGSLAAALAGLGRTAPEDGLVAAARAAAGGPGGAGGPGDAGGPGGGVAGARGGAAGGLVAGVGHGGGGGGTGDPGRLIAARVGAHKHYPTLARRRGLEGLVLVEFAVGPAGHAVDLAVIQSAGAVLDEAARDAVRRAGPLPAVAGRVQVPLRFRLTDDVP
jgi:TonB family protein